METKVTQRPHSGGTQYTITGLQEDVAKVRQAIYAGYHPVGYGTRTDVERCIDPETGTWECVVWRADSCD